MAADHDDGLSMQKLQADTNDFLGAPYLWLTFRLADELGIDWKQVVPAAPSPTTTADEPPGGVG